MTSPAMSRRGRKGRARVHHRNGIRIADDAPGGWVQVEVNLRARMRRAAHRRGITLRRLADETINAALDVAGAPR